MSASVDDLLLRGFVCSVWSAEIDVFRISASGYNFA